MSRQLLLGIWLNALLGSGCCLPAVLAAEDTVAAPKRAVVLFPFREGDHGVGVSQWLTSAVKQALRDSGHYEVILFDIGSPLVQRALTDAQISRELLARPQAATTRREVARALGAEAALSGEISTYSFSAGQRRVVGKLEVLIELVEVASARLLAFKVNVEAQTSAYRKGPSGHREPKPEAERKQEIFSSLAAQIEAQITRQWPEEGPAVRESLSPELVSPPPLPALPQDALTQARNLAANGQIQEAVEAYTRAIMADPQNAALYLELGQLFAQVGNWEKAAREYSHAVEVEPENVTAYLRWGEALLRLQNTQQAAQVFKQVLNLDKENETAHLALAEAYLSLGNTEEAVAELEALLAFTADPYAVLMRLGDIARGQGRLEEALQRYQAALLQRPQDRPARRRLGEVLLALDRLPQALIEVSKLLGPPEQAPPSLSPEMYRWAVNILDTEARRLAQELEATIMAYRQATRGKAATLTTLNRLTDRLRHLLALTERLLPPAVHEQSHKHRRLSYSLLAQTAAEYGVYVQEDDVTAYERALIAQDQARRELNTAREREARQR